MSLQKVKMPEQKPEIRNKNFSEVALGYDKIMAKEEAARCLGCKNKPCVSGCPVNVDIPEFIKLITEDKFNAAYNKIRETNSLPAVCGRVCPQENQCESKCVRGLKGEAVAVGRLERFCADYHFNNDSNPSKTYSNEANHHNLIKVAVIGSGPASLTCAGDLAKMGFGVTVFEALHTPGGVLVYGIPQFRLPKEIVFREIENLKKINVSFIMNTVIGKTLSIDDLFNMDYKACFIGTGAGLPSFMGIPGEELIGVMSANEYLTRINLMKAYMPEYDTPIPKNRSVAVIGGGNVAMDAARCAKRLGAEVRIIYRRGMEEIPARKEEIHHAAEEGIIFNTLTNPVEIVGDESHRVKSIKCIEMELGEADSSGRRRPLPKPDSEFTVEADAVIMAVGTSPNPLLRETEGNLGFDGRGHLLVTEPGMKTAREGVWAGGDIVTGAATVIKAMGAGKDAAASIAVYLKEKYQ